MGKISGWPVALFKNRLERGNVYVFKKLTLMNLGSSLYEGIANAGELHSFYIQSSL
jgi:hypothetical protein